MSPHDQGQNCRKPPRRTRKEGRDHTCGSFARLDHDGPCDRGMLIVVRMR